MSDPILNLSILQSLVFLINSRLGHFSAAIRRWLPFSRSYGVNLPNSLAMNHSSALVYSTQLRVSVYSTGTLYLKLSRFSWNVLPTYLIDRSRLVLSGSTQMTYLTITLNVYTLKRTIPSVRSSFKHPSLHRSIRWYRNINLLSIDYPLRDAR